jgi:DNA/RNA endonuclease YhcR with UshA esterase domain
MIQVIPRAVTENAQREFFGNVIPFVANAGASITPDSNRAETQAYTLTANTTVNAPANSIQPQIGMTLCLVLIQDATGGRTVAWNAAYRNVPAINGATATSGQRITIEFRFDGINWQCCGSSTAFA